MLDGKDEERFEEATDIRLPYDSRSSSPVGSARQLRYDGEYRARQTSDFRGGTRGAGQSSQPLFAAKRERGNPFGEGSEARPQPTGQDTQTYTTFPNQMKVEKVTKETFHVWKVKMKLAAINAKCYKAFEKRSVGSDQDAAGLFLLMSFVPDMWQKKLSVIGNLGFRV